MNYTDDSASQALINTIIKKAPLSAEKELRELCSFNTRTADLFWQEYMYEDDYAPYAMMSKNDHVSDAISDRLNEYLDIILDKALASESDCLDAYYLLSFCTFKHTPRLLRTYRRIAASHDKLRRLRIGWHNMADKAADSCPEFLSSRMREEQSEHSEYTFLRYLNDILIITMYDDILSNGFKSRYIADMDELFSEYPDAFIPARFALSFVRDNSKAYDEYAFLRSDPTRYYELMWVLDGLYSDGGAVFHGSPVIMTGPTNKKFHIEMKIDHLDTRWLSFLCAMPFILIAASGTNDPYYAREASYRPSAALCALSIDNSDIAEKMSGYFEDAAYICGSMHDMIGLRICGNIRTAEELTQLYERSARLAAEGRLSFRPELMTAVFTDDKYASPVFTAEECQSAMNAAAAVLGQYSDSGGTLPRAIKRVYDRIK